MKAKEAKYQIELEKCSLFVRRITPTPSMLLNHADTLSKINCLYPIERVWPKFFTLNKGVREFDLANISQGQLPSRIIVGLVSTKAFSGSVDTDPYKFQHFNLDYISLQCNGRAIPSIPPAACFSIPGPLAGSNLLLTIWDWIRAPYRPYRPLWPRPGL